MRVRRIFSGLLLGLGCATAFIGLLALTLPAISNDQLQLVLASFSMPPDNGFVGLVNQAMRFALANALPLTLTGLFAALAGGLLLWHFWRRMEAESAPFVRLYHAIPTAQPQDDPNPFAAAVTTFQPAEAAPEQPGRYSPFPPILEQNAIESHPSPYARPVEEEKPMVQEPVSAVEEEPAPQRISLQPADISAPRTIPLPEVKSESPSGSRLLVRAPLPEPPCHKEEEPTPVPAPASEEKAPLDEKVPSDEKRTLPEPTPPSEAPHSTPTPPSFTPEPAPPFISPRIRTTMGKHTL